MPPIAAAYFSTETAQPRQVNTQSDVIRLAFIRGIEMTQQFTASEVRTESCKQGQLHRQPASDMLNAFADMLEAREKAAPSDAERLQPPSNLQEALCVIENAALHGVTLHGDDIPRLRATVDRIAPAQQSQDAERLAEAVRNGLIDALRHQRQIDEDGAEVGVSRQAVDEAAAILSALAAHSAQAQPPAASLTFATPETEEDVMAYLRVAKLHIKRFREILQAALAAQENPNG